MRAVLNDNTKNVSMCRAFVRTHAKLELLKKRTNSRVILVEYGSGFSLISKGGNNSYCSYFMPHLTECTIIVKTRRYTCTVQGTLNRGYKWVGAQIAASYHTCPQIMYHFPRRGAQPPAALAQQGFPRFSTTATQKTGSPTSAQLCSSFEGRACFPCTMKLPLVHETHVLVVHRGLYHACSLQTRPPWGRRKRSIQPTRC